MLLEDDRELLPEDRDALLADEDEALGALRDDDEDLEGELTFGALLDDPDVRGAVLLLLPTEREGVEARGDGALRLPVEVRGTIGDRLKPEPLDEPVLGMTTGDRVDGVLRDCPAVDRLLVPELRDPTSGADRLPEFRVDGVTGVRPVLGARERPDGDEGVLVDGEDLVPEGAATPPPAEPWLDPVPNRVPTGLKVERKMLPPVERPPARSEASYDNSPDLGDAATRPGVR